MTVTPPPPPPLPRACHACRTACTRLECARDAEEAYCIWCDWPVDTCSNHVDLSLGCATCSRVRYSAAPPHVYMCSTPGCVVANLAVLRVVGCDDCGRDAAEGRFYCAVCHGWAPSVADDPEVPRVFAAATALCALDDAGWWGYPCRHVARRVLKMTWM